MLKAKQKSGLLSGFIIGTFLCASLLASKSACAHTSPAGSSSYFDGLDRTFKKTTDSNSLLGHRYLRLSARLSVYALSCDEDNQAGYNTAVSRFQNRNTILNQLMASALGGEVAAFNSLENARNDESLRFARFAKPEQICAQSLSQFETILSETETSLQKDFSAASFGSR